MASHDNRHTVSLELLDHLTRLPRQLTKPHYWHLSPSSAMSDVCLTFILGGSAAVVKPLSVQLSSSWRSERKEKLG